ncbi:MAG: DoxX family protein [Pseudonocardia sp.]
MLGSLRGPAADVAILLGRFVIGFTMVARGWLKLVTRGLDETTIGFEKLDVPLPAVSAALVGGVELVGGALLVVGALTAVAGVAVSLVMLGATVLVHAPNGFYTFNGGWELVGVIGAGALLLAGFGAGRYSVDHVVAARRTRAPA